MEPARVAVGHDRFHPRDLLKIWHNKAFFIFCLASLPLGIILGQLSSTFSVFCVRDMGIPEAGVGYFCALNGVIVVLLQFPMTRLVRKANRLRVMAAGALLFALATGSVTLAEAFPHFALVMVVLTLGENLAVPTATTVAADFAPPELRGRYMGALGFAWIIAWGAAPMLAGLLSDHYGPQSPWLAGAAAGVLVAAALWGLGGGVKRET